MQLLVDKGARLDARLTKDGPMRGGVAGLASRLDAVDDCQGVFYAGTFKRQLETASLLRRLMAEQGLPVEPPPAEDRELPERPPAE